MRQRLLAGMLVLVAVACVPSLAQRRQRKGELRDVQPPWVEPGKTATIQLFGQDVAGTEIGFKVPVVVRLEGTNVEKAREILNGAKGKLPTLIAATDLTDAAKKVVAAVA